MNTFFIRAPSAIFHCRVATDQIPGYRWQEISTQEVFGGRRIALFAVPGAFTPVCTSAHLPGYEEKYFELRSLGIDDVYCISVNDSFAMNAWFKSLGIQHVKPLPDGSGEFTRKLGYLVDRSNHGFGMRSWRYSAILRDGVVEMMWAEPGFADHSEEDPFVVSDVNTMIAYLRDQREHKSGS